ncbi:MAG TPA: TerB family tellurite resistance protein [Ohtaekwangia sp.]|uniref:TerB family tellurite resistance protein n=1 Tax=Ohtaekwangia sp. TaxID=2066019 RepID=UPI002F942066
MQIEKLEILRSIAEMAYVIAKADKGLSSEERIAFHKIIQEELDYDSWAAQSRFELLDEVIQPSIEKAYNEAMHDFKKYRDHLTDDLRLTAVRVMQRVAEACSGLHENEALIIDRFKKDLQHL